MDELKTTPRFNYGETAIESQKIKLNEEEIIKQTKKQSKSHKQTPKINPCFSLLCKKFQLRNDFDKEHCDAFLASKLQTFEDFPFDDIDISKNKTNF